MIAFSKQPDDILDYDIDMGKWFGAWAPDDFITSITFVLVSAEEQSPLLVVGPGSHPDTVILGTPAIRFKVWLGSGTINMDYKITFLVVTNQGRRKEVDVCVSVREK